MLEQLALILQTQGFDVSEITPDKKIHRFKLHDEDTEELGFYIAFQLFCAQTGEAFYVAVYGNLNDDTYRDWCTLDDSRVGFDNKRLIKAKIKLAYAIIEKFKDPSEAISPKPDTAMFVYALGFSDNTYFFTSSRNKQIVSVNRFSEDAFLNLMPLEYWETLYPGMNGAKVNWTQAKSVMMDECRKKGIFSSRNVRGSGVWRDQGRTVVNMGDHLVVDNERVELGVLSSQYFYTLGAHLNRLHPDPLTAAECSVLVEACETFKWLKPEFGILLAGSLVTSRVCGALPIRPHLWITGGAGEGKSTLLEKLIRPVLGQNLLYVQGSTTEAGIRQMLKANSVPLLFDEFESTGPKSIEIVQAVLDLLRSAWSDSDAQVVKGSAGGTAQAYKVACSAIVSSIRTKLLNDADVSRFARIELMPHGNDVEHWAQLSTLLNQLNSEYCDRLFARAVKLMPVLLANYKLLKSALSKRVSSRFGDQYGMLLAGYAILLQDEIIDAVQVQTMIDRIGLLEEREEAKVADHTDCLTHLVTKKVSMEILGNRKDFSIGEAILQFFSTRDDEIKKALLRIGIRVDFEKQHVAIATKHSELESQVFRGERWSKSWGNSLSRLPGAFKGAQMWIGGNTRPICIPLDQFKS